MYKTNPTNSEIKFYCHVIAACKKPREELECVFCFAGVAETVPFI